MKLLPSLDVVQWLDAAADTLAVDTETTVVDLTRYVPDLVVLSLGDGRESVVVFARDVDVAPWFEHWMADPNHVLVFHNAAFDLAVLHRAGLDRGPIATWIRQGRIHDTMLTDQLLRLATGGEGPGRPGSAYYHKTYDGTLPRRSLATLAQEYLGETLTKGEVRVSFGDVRRGEDLTTEQVEYAAADVGATWRLWRLLRLRLQDFGVVPNDYGLLTDAVQIGAAVALAAIGRRGLCLDDTVLETAATRTQNEQEEAAAVLDDAGVLVVTGRRKLRVHLLEKDLRHELARRAVTLGFSPPLTPTGRLSLSREHWDQYAGQDPVVDAFIAYKKSEKRLGAFIRQWRRFAAADGVIRAQYRPFVATGRTSCHSPNLQQVPRRQGSLRECFRAREGIRFWELDYQTLELCTVAQCCLDLFGQSTLADVLNTGADVHRWFAARIWQKPTAEITKDERFVAKMANFGFWGGMGPATFQKHLWTLARLRVDLDRARYLRQTWLDAYPEARPWLARANERPLARGLGVYNFPPRAERAVLTGRPDPALELVTRAQVRQLWQAVRAHREELHLDFAVYPTARLVWPAIEMEKGSPVLYDWLQWRRSVTPTGRVRCPTGYSEFLNTPFQGLAADGAKLALLELWEKNVFVVAFVHDSVLIEAKGWSRAAEVAEIMVRNMRRVCLDVKIRVEVVGPTTYWGVPEADTETRVFGECDEQKGLGQSAAGGGSPGGDS